MDYIAIPIRIRGGASVWNDGSPASIVLDSVAFAPDVLPPAPSGALKRWNGTEWVAAQFKRWNGSAWADCSVLLWDGTAWVAAGSSGPSSGTAQVISAAALAVNASASTTASVTVPASATGYAIFWHFWSDGTGAQLNSISSPALAAPTFSPGNRNGGGNDTGAGVAYGEVITTGATTIDIGWNNAPELGPSVAIVFFTGTVQAASVYSGTWEPSALSGSVASTVDNPVIIFQGKISETPPATPVGATSVLEGSVSGVGGWYASGFRISTIAATGANTSVETGTEAYPALILLSLSP